MKTGGTSKRLDPLAVPLEGTSLIEASAGTGKTYTITTLYLRLLIERRLDVREILVVTYTIAATAELRRRVRDRLRLAHDVYAGSAPPDADPDVASLMRLSRERESLDADRRHLQASLRAFDENAILTIHGFCLRALNDNALESGASFAPAFLPDQALLYVELAHDFWAAEIYEAPEIFVRYLQKRGVSPASLTGLVEAVSRDPSIVLLPPEREVLLHEPLQRWRTAFDRAAELWRTHRAELIDLLAAAPELDHNKYRAGPVRGEWGGELDDLFAMPLPDLPSRWKWIGKVTRSGIANGARKGRRPPEHPFFDACEVLAGPGGIDAELVGILEERTVQLIRAFAAWAPGELARRKERRGEQSFDDLLLRLQRALRAGGGDRLAARLRQRHPVALIDEFQDTDAVQYEVFQRVYGAPGDHGLFLIGDPKQAIYGFRGADVFAYVRAKRAVRERTFTLDTNYRSDPRLLDALNALFGRPSHPFLLDGIDYVHALPRPGAAERLRGGGGALRSLFVRSEGRARSAASAQDTMLPALAADVVRLFESGATIDGAPVGPRHVAVLVRTNLQAMDVQRALRRAGIPSVLQSQSSVFEQREALELERVLRAVLEPGDARAIKAALTTTLLGVRADALAALEEDAVRWEAWIGAFRQWNHIWQRNGFIQMLRPLLDDNRVQERLLAFEDGERRLTNLLHLRELLQTASSDCRMGPRTLVAWLARMRTDVQARQALGEEAAQLRLESDADAVTLVTVHKSKGLQYPIVYLPHLWSSSAYVERRSPYARFHDDEGRLVVDLAAPEGGESREKANRERLAEELRLAYVALTRAEHQVNVVWGQFAGGQDAALTYLLHQPPGFTVFDDDPLAATVARAEHLDDAGRLADLEAIATSAPGGAVEIVDDLLALPHSVWTAPSSSPDDLACRRAARPVPPGRRVSSFSRLVGEGHGAPSREGLDWDGVDGRGGERDARAGSPESDAVPLAELPAGTATGLLVHALLETVDFGAAPDDLRTAVIEALRRHGFDGVWAEPIAQALGGALRTPLGAVLGQACLADVPVTDRLDELEFVVPLARADEPLVASRLASVFSAQGAPQWLRAYGRRVGELGFVPVHGHLKGYVDLVFRRGERWFVVDYKTNHLGHRPADYAPERLVAEMAVHHYPLQYHLYALAVDRYLRMRLPAYDYERHFGGVYYLFLRGMAPEHPAGCGIFFERPPNARIEALRRALSGTLGGTLGEHA